MPKHFPNTTFKAINQARHVTKPIERFDLQDAKPTTLPMAPSTMGKHTSKPLSDPTLYSALVGVLNSESKPETCYAVHIFSTKAHSPTLADLNRAKKYLTWLRNQELILLLPKQTTHEI